MKRPILISVVVVLSIGVLAGGGYGIYRWRLSREKKAPIDLSSVEPEVAWDFIASDEFAQWPDWKRQKYVLAAIDKLGEKPLEELIKQAMTPDPGERRKKIGENMKRLPD